MSCVAAIFAVAQGCYTAAGLLWRWRRHRRCRLRERTGFRRVRYAPAPTHALAPPTLATQYGPTFTAALTYAPVAVRAATVVAVQNTAIAMPNAIVVTTSIAFAAHLVDFVHRMGKALVQTLFTWSTIILYMVLLCPWHTSFVSDRVRY